MDGQPEEPTAHLFEANLADVAVAYGRAAVLGLQFALKLYNTPLVGSCRCAAAGLDRNQHRPALSSSKGAYLVVFAL